jgi:WXG100 family type VII secretion target
MASEKIRVNYPALEEMAKHCDQTAQRLQQTASLAGKISAQMQNGALQGEFGETFVQALGVFSQKVNKLATKFTEEAGDIRGAMSDMRAADQKAGAKF